ncbi:SDR family oxidoreductase [Parashewanella curva]|uniref:SDR family oxidoreductase n=1 Tax=Parashewanella curva TaxID=2338552 RepID=A0A3L8PTM7_9GAMM|nr:SDR family oxidoreductase [Parashewanella curva]RLV58767.1 SDR family oxidoreductase [Parashewanella curva]
MGTSVLVTGSAKGFGYLIVNTLLDSGFTVVASMRDPYGKDLAIADELELKGARVVAIDVTNDRSVIKGVAQAIEDVGEIDVLINNAGRGALGWQESFTIDDFKSVFDINVFGVQRMIRAVLPYMKLRQSGTLIQISSTLGQFVLPFMGAYNASKHAIEGLSETYRVELSQYGIQTLVVEPGGYGTGFLANSLKANDSEVTSTYAKKANAPELMVAGFEKSRADGNDPDPQMVADAILDLLQTNPIDRPFRTVVDGESSQSTIQSINEVTEDCMQTIYKSYGMDNLLKLKQ